MKAQSLSLMLIMTSLLPMGCGPAAQQPPPQVSSQKTAADVSGKPVRDASAAATQAVTDRSGKTLSTSPRRRICRR